VRVATSDRAEKVIRRRGGIAYVWLDQRLRATTTRPDGVPFEEVLADGYRLFIDARMNKPELLRLTVAPWRGLRAAVPVSKSWFWRAVSKGQDVSELHGG
jgi:hypothetical protein